MIAGYAAEQEHDEEPTVNSIGGRR